MFKYVIDEDLELKLLDNSHIEEQFALTQRNRSYLKQWLPWVDGIKSFEDVAKFIKKTKKQFVDNDGFQCGIWYKGRMAGIIGYHNIDWTNKSTSIGYWLGEEFQNKGIMIRDCKVLVDYAVKELGLNRVEIRCAEKNLKSRHIPEKLGFKNEGTLRNVEWLYDHYVSHVVYGILKDEWI
ncbi:GNAT family N-acetyltransferase [Clostridium sp. P21]|uniref:GNAT family N-acetyltransferase n=1 Tax=Clostridium muellerianum TaxID=2716538 RepID=A0A7Y0EHV2_9CLOT|nr:GNAT family protein [Clostridium muellerianum]NMM63769.1 GNAT family N-acetyltransferase [Clostridium muellerianum]